jgi:hypothetical protein
MAPDGSGHTPDGCMLREHLCARCHPRPPPRTRASGPSSRGRKSSRRLDATGSARARPGAHTAGGSVGNVSILALASGSSKPRQAGRHRQLQRDDLQRSPCSARSAAIPAHGSACRLTFRERGLDLDHAIGVPATAGNRWSGGTCRASGPLERRLIPSSCPGPVEWSFSGPKPKKFHGEQFRAAPPRAGRRTSPAGGGARGGARPPQHASRSAPRVRSLAQKSLDNRCRPAGAPAVAQGRAVVRRLRLGSSMGGAWSRCFGTEDGDEHDVEAGKGGRRAIGNGPAPSQQDVDERRAALARAAEERERKNAVRGTQRTTYVLEQAAVAQERAAKPRFRRTCAAPRVRCRAGKMRGCGVRQLTLLPLCHCTGRRRRLPSSRPSPPTRRVRRPQILRTGRRTASLAPMFAALRPRFRALCAPAGSLGDPSAHAGLGLHRRVPEGRGERGADDDRVAACSVDVGGTPAGSRCKV